MYSAYVLRSLATGHLYIGSTGDFARRLAEHQRGDARYTRGRGPWQVVLVEDFGTRAEALSRERALKSGQGRAWLKDTIGGRAGPSAEGLTSRFEVRILVGESHGPSAQGGPSLWERSARRRCPRNASPPRRRSTGRLMAPCVASTLAGPPRSTAFSPHRWTDADICALTLKARILAGPTPVLRRYACC